jgi:hypothetical protein
LKNQCRELFKQELNTKEEAKTRDSQTYKNKVEKFPPCTYYKKTNHQPIKCWWRPNIKCRKCGQIGHAERIYRTQQHE